MQRSDDFAIFTPNESPITLGNQRIIALTFTLRSGTSTQDHHYRWCLVETWSRSRLALRVGNQTVP